MSEEVAQSTPKTLCRKCYEQVPVDVKYCPQCGTALSRDSAPVILVVLLLASSLLLMSSSYVTTKQISGEKPATAPVQSAIVQPPKDMAQSAYAAARHFAEQQYPGGHISALNESSVSVSGGSYQVTLFVDTAQGASAVRNVAQLKLEWDRGNWKVTPIQ